VALPLQGPLHAATAHRLPFSARPPDWHFCSVIQET